MMQIKDLRQSKERGSVLLTALVLSAVLGVTLSGYLYWVRTQNILVAQSQAWNAALVHAEAGVEEGMAQLNVVFGTNYQGSAAANWGGSVSDGAFGPRTHSFSNGSYSVTIRPTVNPIGPVIISTGYATVPLIGRTVSRTVEVCTRANSAFGLAMAALQDIGMNGNYVMVDSYDSGDLAHSTNGLYDAATRKPGGDIASTGGMINVGNADIFGHVRTAPSGSASVGANGRAGDLTTVWNGSGIQPGWYDNDYNAVYPDVTDPFDPATAIPLPAATNGTLTLFTGDYIVYGDLDIPNNQTLEVAGTARLWVQGNFRMIGQLGSFLNIGVGQSIKLYVGTQTGPQVTSSFTTVNNAGNAFNFQYYGLPSNVAVTWGGNASYIGTVYAPEATFTLNGSGNNTYSDYQGSCVVREVTMNGHFNFHYDENLGRRGPASGYVAYRWREI